MARPVIRSVDAQRNLDVLLAFAVAGVLGNRFFLVATGYPQLGGGTLHISHAIWGGLMMIVAVAAAVAVVTPGVRLFVAVVGGAGFGWFVDELGKFITRDVNYFYRPTLALIYVVFIVMYLAFRLLRGRRDRPEDGLVNALETLKLAAIGRLLDHERRHALELVDRGGSEEPFAAAVRGLLVDAPVVAPSRPSAGAKASIRVHDRVQGWAERPLFPALLTTVLVLLSCSDVAQVVALVVRKDTMSLSDWVIVVSIVVSATLVVVGALRVRRSRLAAYRFFEASVLVAIFVTQVFLFHEAQLGGVLDLTVDVARWGCIAVGISVERRRGADARRGA